ncbi:hypothetical protein [Limosilactobacillus fastidiosus]|uniref:Uncharacterized protein n=1 Tax=Limosilactobacillus fastidiosus TaxID=2759855 RepID=A0A7W3TZW8_9LACO|nr:hypothetical protein [Limosilactobacillus fastidiosus]MBB1086366.1 hypothetical protein [Limosilactobacillus fastidiosus]MCD7086259.1 hypothetical protein [Limosilactobacillus fastidiosus]MCD7115022.1 hypothetical protein [Limosilactobacillus fastidiosus]MCD7116815.1 hypothetical protein [Limosilactobacillus fastidiosus]
MADDIAKSDSSLVPPNDDTPYLSAIISQFGTDTDDPSVRGLGYSPDNGVHFYVTDTIKGRKYRQEDADRLWKYLESMVQKLIDDKFEELNDMNKKDGDKQNGFDSNVSE